MEDAKLTSYNKYVTCNVIVVIILVSDIGSFEEMGISIIYEYI